MTNPTPQSKPDPAITSVSNVPKAALWMLGAVVAFTAMAIGGREAGGELNTFELMTYRSAIGLVLVVSIAWLSGTHTQIRVNRMPSHILRNVSHFAGQNLWLWAITVIPLAQVFALEFTSPLWVVVFAALFLGERLTWIKSVAGILGFIGILMVLQPGTAPISLGMVAAGGAAIFFAITAIFTKRLTSDQSITCILFWLTAIQLGLGLAFSLYDGHITLPSSAALPWVIVIALGGLAAHFCLTSALTLAPASVVIPIDFVRLPAIAILGVILYDETLQIGILAGAALILGANYINVLSEHRRSRNTSRTARTARVP